MESKLQSMCWLGPNFSFTTHLMIRFWSRCSRNLRAIESQHPIISSPSPIAASILRTALLIVEVLKVRLMRTDQTHT